MQPPTNGASTHWNGNGAVLEARVPVVRHTPASIFLLSHVERISRELGRADTVLEDLSARVNTLEQRLAALELDDVRPAARPLEFAADADLVVEIPALEPPRLTAQPAPEGLIRLLSRMEALGLEVGRTETELDIVRDEAQQDTPDDDDIEEPVEETEAVEPVIVVEELVIAETPSEPDRPEPEIEQVIAEVPLPDLGEPPAVEIPPDVQPARLSPMVAIGAWVAKGALQPARLGHIIFAAVAARPVLPEIKPIRRDATDDLAGTPLQILPQDVFASDEAHRAVPLRVDDGVVAPPEPLPRRRRTPLLVAAAIALALLATIIIAATAWVRADGNQPETVATATSQPESAATVPPASATLAPLNEGAARLPGVYGMIASATVGGGGSLSLVGASHVEITSMFGEPTEMRTDGGVAYLDGEILLRYSPDGRVVSATFDLTPEALSPADADVIFARYRPSDARLLDQKPLNTGGERTRYTSPSLQATFAGQDTAGYDPSVYIEELHTDAAGTVTALVISLAETD